MASFASSATTCGARKHAWTKNNCSFAKIHCSFAFATSQRTCEQIICVSLLTSYLLNLCVGYCHYGYDFYIETVKVYLSLRHN